MSQRKRNIFLGGGGRWVGGGCFVLFNELLILPWFNCFLNFPVIRENGDYFTVIIGLFKLFV